MDELLQDWQRQHLPRRRPRGPHRQPPREKPVAPRMSKHQEDLVAIDAGSVTVVGTQAEVEFLAEAAGLYGPGADEPPMAEDEDHIMTGVYIGVGLLLAAGAGYLAWRYLLDDAQKRSIINQSKDMLADGITASKRVVRDARGKIPL